MGLDFNMFFRKPTNKHKDKLHLSWKSVHLPFVLVFNHIMSPELSWEVPGITLSQNLGILHVPMILKQKHKIHVQALTLFYYSYN